jgi:hypothetical protein
MTTGATGPTGASVMPLIVTFTTWVVPSTDMTVKSSSTDSPSSNDCAAALFKVKLQAPSASTDQLP